ncbi:MAG: hypothetical protein PWP46_2226 [Fusobacteriaceae bacterium]|nr:hypothetical protein [Fusobacteriaceae bacterium]
MKKIGITTTVPIEVLLAAGYKVVDLNNAFIVSDDYREYIHDAEKYGFPKSMCAWIKGIYSACISEGIKEVVAVVEGDCSNTKVLLELFKEKGIKLYPFSYPHSHKIEDITREIDNFISLFNVSIEEVENIRNKINIIREKAKKIDELTLEGKVSGFENHITQLCLSDFDGDLDKYDRFLDEKLEEIEKRTPDIKKINLGLIGVPTMFSDLHEFVEKFDSRIIYNEVPREFAFPRATKYDNIYEQYYDYTYPYDIDYRIQELEKQIKDRKLDGIIHYTQSFCHRAMEDIIIKNRLNIPVLNIEGDKDDKLDARTKLRIEAFLDMLLDLKKRGNK